MANQPVFYVGEQPTAPFIITVRDDETLEVIDLTDYDSVEVTGDGLPDGVSSIADAEGGRVQYVFSEPFEESGVIDIVVRLLEGEAGVDLSHPGSIRVDDPATEGTYTVISPTDAEKVTGVSVSRSQLLMAQGLIGLIIDRDLSDGDVVTSFSTNDQRRLRQAVAWQSTVDPTSATVNVPAGATSISTGDVSISFGDGNTFGAFGSLHMFAQSAINTLSWRSGIRSIRLGPNTGTRRYNPFLNAGVSDDHPWLPIR